ncbi:hypothetical protein [Thermoactinomyces mirandus]|uniref:Competence protein ComGF n=1 Tax=Thermoactinomyces mirandus TaxID=2756294 RepID=A0A7W1XUY6_9BACL|nr:hypothetical protein [Thermoactinomyces mirandus]MBA4603460.1 hypothetical protein [Thermoactinomyces mirandus]
MERFRREDENQTVADTSLSSLKTEYGFTFVETGMVLSILVFFLPALFFAAFTVEKQIREAFGKTRMHLDYLSFSAWIERDIQKGVYFQEEDDILYIHSPDGNVIRYHLRDRNLIRSVQARGENRFRGTTIVLKDVYYAIFLPDIKGVGLDVGLQNWYAHQEFATYFSARTQSGQPW